MPQLRAAGYTIALVVSWCIAASAGAQPVPAARDVEPVVMTGFDLPGWSGRPAITTCAPWPSGTSFLGGRDAHNGTITAPPAVGVPVDEIAAYRWTGLTFTEIPVQVDEMFQYCLSNPPSDFSDYSGTDKELTYAWDEESWRKVDGECEAAYPPGPEGQTLADPVPTLDDDDEIVFMASDAGGIAHTGVLLPAGVSAVKAVAIIDPLNPGEVRFVYLARKAGGSAFHAGNGYVTYLRDADADEWIDRYSIARDEPEILGVSNTGYGPNLTGTTCRTATYPGYPEVADGAPRPSSDRFVRDGVTVTTDAYRWRASGRWMVRSLRVAKPGQPGLYGPDLIDRWKGRAFQQSPDSTISLVGFEDEQVNWEANSALLGERVGPVRAIREVWGADSGTNVTKIETFYRDVITYRYHVRVHPIPPDGLYTSWDYNAGVAAKYYNVVQPDGVDIDGINDDTGNVDGVFGFPAFFDVPDPAFTLPSAILNWEQVSGAGDAGSLVYIIELKGATTLANPAVVPYYRDDMCLDDGTGDDPVARPWPGEDSQDRRVTDGYSAAAGGTPYESLTCDQRQGAWGAHGVHYFVTGDTDNAASPEVLTEIDAQQWQFTVPTATPTNVGQEYGNVVIAPLQFTTLDVGATPSLTPSAGDTAAATDEDVAVDVTLSGLALAACELTFSIIDPPTSGTLGAIADQPCTVGLPNSDTATVTYTPASGFSGEDAFTYRVSDGVSDSQPATATITVKEAPVAPPCGDGPATGCRAPVKSGKARLLMKDGRPDSPDRFVWKWAAGQATAKAELGDPSSTTGYELCVYDGSSTVLVRALAPAGSCDGRPCWRETGRGYTYRNRQRASGEPRSKLAQKVVLKAGAEGKAKIIVKEIGAIFGLQDLPFDETVTVQLTSSEGTCWQATYSQPAARNDEDQYKDRAD